MTLDFARLRAAVEHTNAPDTWLVCIGFTFGDLRALLSAASTAEQRVAEARAEGWNAALLAAREFLRAGAHEVFGQPDSVGRRHAFDAISIHRVDKIVHLNDALPTPDQEGRS